MFFWCVFFEASNHIFCKTCEKNNPKRDPKGDPKPIISRMSDLSKHMVFTVRIPHFAVLDVLWDPFFFTPFFRHCFFSTFSSFLKIGAKMVPKMDEDSMQEMCQIQPCHQKAPMRPQGEPRAFQITPKKFCTSGRRYSVSVGAVRLVRRS